MSLLKLTRGLVLAVPSLLIVGCGAAAGGAGIPLAANGEQGRQPAVVSPTASPTPPSPPTTPPPPPAPATAKPAAPAPAPPSVQTFAIRQRFPGGASGSVTAVAGAGGVHYHVVVTGLVPDSAHTIHDHVGSCSNPNGSRHLTVLDTSTADSGGTIVFDATVPSFDFGAGRIVIVYSSATPALITGCADL